MNYREAYGLHASNGILFNHESPIRGETFVSRKITRAVAAIARGRQDVVRLGNLDARRDWGHARDFVEGMWRMATHRVPGDYVPATGAARSVRELVETAFAETGVDIGWQGSGVAEQGVDAATGAVRVAVDPRYFRPAEVDLLVGDASKARRELGWRPRTPFRELVAEMVRADLAVLDDGYRPARRRNRRMQRATLTPHTRGAGAAQPPASRRRHRRAPSRARQAMLTKVHSRRENIAPCAGV